MDGAVVVSNRAATADAIKQLTGFYTGALKNTYAPMEYKWQQPAAISLNPLHWAGIM